MNWVLLFVVGILVSYSLAILGRLDRDLPYGLNDRRKPRVTRIEIFFIEDNE